MQYDQVRPHSWITNIFHLSLMKWLDRLNDRIFFLFHLAPYPYYITMACSLACGYDFITVPFKNGLTLCGGKLWSHWLSFVWRRASFVDSHSSGREPIKEHQSQTFKLQTQPCLLTGLPIRQTFGICIAPQAEIHAWPLTEITYRLSLPAFDGLADSVGRMECRVSGCHHSLLAE